MEVPSSHGHRWRVPWQGLLLAVSLCLFWIPPSNGSFIFESKQYYASKTTHVILKLQKLPMYVERYLWYKGNNTNVNNQIGSYKVMTGKMIPGPAYNGKQILYAFGKLRIQNVTKEDSGYYTVEAIMINNHRVKASTHLFILEPETPFSVQENKITVRENENVGIICLTNEPDHAIHWVFNGQKLKQKDKRMVSQHQAVINLSNIIREYAGQYQCKYRKLSSSGRSTPLRLEVL